MSDEPVRFGGNVPNRNRGGGGGGGRGGPHGGGNRGGGRGGGGGHQGGGDRRGPGGGPNRGGPGGPRGGPGGHNRDGPRRDFVLDRLGQIQGPTHELPAINITEKKFSGRSRLYVGNLAPETTEENLKKLASECAEVGEIFFNSEKHFAFVKMGSKLDAEKMKKNMDGKLYNGRSMKVRIAPHQGAVKVANLSPFVSNELLHRAFSIFGEIERCLVFVDDRGRTKGTGIVEFEQKKSAMEAVRRCQDGCFFITAAPRPVVAELAEDAEDEDGLTEKMIPKRNADFMHEREVAPRFASTGSFEFEYGQKWKALYDLKKQKLEALDREMKLEEDKLIGQMEYARYEHETETLRNQLRMRESQMDQRKTHWEQREQQMSDMMAEEQQRQNFQEQNMRERIQHQDELMRQRQQENSLFMQAQELDQMLNQQEGMFGGPMGGQMGGPFGGGGGHRGGNQGGRGGGYGGNKFGPRDGGDQGRGGNGFGPRGGSMEGGFPNKRRRF